MLVSLFFWLQRDIITDAFVSDIVFLIQLTQDLENIPSWNLVTRFYYLEYLNFSEISLFIQYVINFLSYIYH